jgi:geranylgeranyl reductase family protein
MADKSTHFDIIIAGGGPAGSTAAYLLSKAGLNVLIIDKSKFPRKKLCGGLITYKTVRLLERVFGVTVDTLNKHGIIEYESDHYEIYGKKRLITERSYEIPFRFIDREKYDNFLLQKALQTGASLVEGDGVREIDLSKSSIKTQRGWYFTADVIIGADGVNSRVRRSFPVDLFGREDWTENVASAHEVIISRDRVKKQIDHPMLYFGPVNHGYAWIFPNRDTVTAGICGLKGKTGKNILSAFRKFLDEMDLSHDGDERIHSYVLPYGCYLPSPVFRNMLLIGDAAGFADPLWGEGIYYSQKSAELAAQAIINIKDDNKSFNDMKEYYLPMLKNDILIEMEYAEKIRKAIFRYYKIFDFFLLSKIMNINADKPIEMIHGIRSYKWMNKLQ